MDRNEVVLLAIISKGTQLVFSALWNGSKQRSGISFPQNWDAV
jgi:hypothetical protein